MICHRDFHRTVTWFTRVVFPSSSNNTDRKVKPSLVEGFTTGRLRSSFVMKGPTMFNSFSKSSGYNLKTPKKDSGSWMRIILRVACWPLFLKKWWLLSSRQRHRILNSQSAFGSQMRTFVPSLRFSFFLAKQMCQKKRHHNYDRHTFYIVSFHFQTFNAFNAKKFDYKRYNQTKYDSSLTHARIVCKISMKCHVNGWTFF